MQSKGLLNPWWVVLGCAVALMTSSGVTQSFTFSLFIQPLSDAFGWSRSLISLGYSSVVVVTAIGSPIVGFILDRFGVRRVVIIAVTLFGLTLGSIGLIPGNPYLFIGLCIIAGAFGAVHSPLPYAKVVAGWFDGQRGLALGVTMAGIGVGGMLIPATVGAVIEAYDWRIAYFVLGAMVVAIALPAVFFLVREPTPGHKHAPVATHSIEGLTRAEAFGNYRFWLLIVTVFLTSMTVNGCAAHTVPILTGHGLTRAAAVAMLPALGFSSLLGRLGAGFLLDRVHAPYVAAGTMVLALCGLGVLWGGESELVLTLGVMLLGSALGAEVDTMGYLTSRYCGLRKFGEIYGYMIAAFALASGVGATLMGMSFDATQSYGTAMALFAGGLGVAIVLTLMLGPYTFPPREAVADGASARPAPDTP